MLRYCLDMTMERYVNRQTGLGEAGGRAESEKRRAEYRGGLSARLRRLRPSRYMTLACCSIARQARRAGG